MVIYCHLSDLRCRIHCCHPFIFLAERARASVEREIVIHARPLTIKGGNIDLKQLKNELNELTRNVVSGVRGERDLCQKK